MISYYQQLVQTDITDSIVRNSAALTAGLVEDVTGKQESVMEDARQGGKNLHVTQVRVFMQLISPYLTDAVLMEI